MTFIQADIIHCGPEGRGPQPTITPSAREIIPLSARPLPGLLSAGQQIVHSVGHFLLRRASPDRESLDMVTSL